jgi:adenine-specific DNA-methyltransferase
MAKTLKQKKKALQSTTSKKRPIVQYEHNDKTRANNPPVGLVTPDTDKDADKKIYAYDPHLDPQLQWAGKAERTTFEIPTVSLHVHERIDPRSIIEAVRKKNGSNYEQMSLFSSKEENPPVRDAIDFYKHPHNWSNRLIAGDRLLVMNSLLEKEGLGGQVQSIYFDPPYGIKYGSNFQPFVNKRDVKDGKDEDLSTQPETIKAFRDTWELGIHSYLSYIRDTILLSRELLTESGSMFVQISDENLHHVREIMDEVFGAKNFVGLIAFKKTSAQTSVLIAPIQDYLLWYGKNISQIKYRRLFVKRQESSSAGTYNWIEQDDGDCRRLTRAEMLGEVPLPKGKVFRAADLSSQTGGESTRFEISFEGRSFSPSTTRGWSTNKEGIERLRRANRLFPLPNVLCYKRYEDDFSYSPFGNQWTDTVIGTFTEKLYVVQTANLVVSRCMLMTTDPGDIVFDPTCGSGTTAFVAEQWGRRWITCDTSRVAIALAKQRLMTSTYDYYELAHSEEGIGSGFRYKTVPHITLKSIANNEPPGQETLYDQPYINTSKLRVTGPFTVEAVPAPVVKPMVELPQEPASDQSIARSGETLRQSDWRDELLRTGIRGKRGQYIEFSRLEPLPGTRYLHAIGETRKNDKGANSVRESEVEYNAQRVVVSFGPEHAPLEQRQVALAIEEAQTLVPKPKMVVFAAFQFDPEAAKDIDETNWPGVTLLKAQMNPDLLTGDLKKARSSNESFWLIGQPDIRLEQIRKGDDKGKWQVSVEGFDYYNTKSGQIESGGTDRIAVWLLDTDYDGRSLFPRQVFFPMSGEGEGWSRLAKTLRAEIEEDLIEAYRGIVSLPFESGSYKRIAVKIVDDRGIESLKVMKVE